jgi:hypothetical protein
MLSKHRCPYCGEYFEVSKYHPNQKVCNKVTCQRQRKADYHRQKRAIDPEYRQTCLDSQRTWRERNPDYQRQYRKKHPEAVECNRINQRERDLKRRQIRMLRQVELSAKKRYSSPLWVMNLGTGNLEKNSLAVPDQIVFQRIEDFKPEIHLEKNTLAFT